MFILAGLAKLARRPEFAAALSSYRLLPARMNALAGVVVPLLELAIGALLFTGVETRAAGWTCAACLLIFSIAVVTNLLRGRRIECGCFGVVAETRLTWTTVARNALLACMAVLVAWRPVPALTVGADNSMSTDRAFALLIAATSTLVAGGLLQDLRVRRGAISLKEKDS